jgi:hypothetical protein
MAFPKGLEWNQLQMKAAFHLDKGKSIAETVTITGLSYHLVRKVHLAMKKGDKPAELTEEAIKKAPLPTKFGQKPEKPPPPGGDGGGPEPPKATSKRLKFYGTLIECEYTPIMMLARTASVEEWNWDANMSMEDWLDTIIYHFFKDRGITIQGYVVDDKVAEQAKQEVAG